MWGNQAMDNISHANVFACNVCLGQELTLTRNVAENAFLTP